MTQTLTVTFDGEAFYPETHLNLEPNKRYKIQILAQEETLEPSSGDAWDILESLAGTVDAPPDWSSEHEHYLYGTPKRNVNNE